MKEVDFFICYELWQRELYGCLLMKYELEKRGYSVLLSNSAVYPDNDMRRQYVRPKVVVYPWIYSNLDMKRALKFKHGADNVVNMECEQFLSETTIPLKFPKDEVAKKAFHVCWGENTRKRYRQYEVDDFHTRVCGNINLDIDRPEFSDLFPQKEDWARKYNLSLNKKWIMFFSDFHFLPNMRKDMEISIKKDKTGKNKHLADLQLKTRNVILGYFEQLLSETDEYLIIYRCHPEEREYHDCKFDKLLTDNNFRSISDGTIQEWIPACDILLSWVSTSLVDAYIMKKRCAVIRPYPIGNDLEGDLFRTATPIVTYQEFKGFCKGIVDAPILEEEYAKTHLWNSSNTGYAYKNVVNWLEEIYHAKPLGISYKMIKTTDEFMRKVKHTVIMEKGTVVRNFIDRKIMAKRYALSASGMYNSKWEILAKLLQQRSFKQQMEDTQRELEWQKRVYNQLQKIES